MQVVLDHYLRMNNLNMMKQIYLHLLCLIISMPLIFGQNPNNDQGDPLSFNIPTLAPAGFSAKVTTIPAGDAVEGDFHISPEFEPEGGECWIAHRATHNISVIDVDNGELKTVLSTAEMPVDITFTDSVALVACFTARVVEVWDWRTETLLSTIPVVGQPARIEVSDDGSIAVVSLEDLDDAVIIDLEDGSIDNFDNFPTGISGFSFITSNTRNLFNYNGFAVSPDGSQIVNGYRGALKFYDIANHTIDSLPGVLNASQVGYSANGDIVVAVVTGSTDPVIYQIDATNKTIINEIRPGMNVGGFNGDLALSNDGQRVLLPGQNSGMLIRFDQNDVVPITTTSAVFWTDIRSDGEVGIAGGYNTHLIDMATGSILGTTSGISLNLGAVSPSGDYILAMDPLRRERVELFHTTRNGVFPIGPVQPGSELEADAPYSVQFTHDGKKVLVVNSLSGSMSIIDVATKEVESIVPLENYEIYHVAITKDDKQAIIGERLADQVSIIDLEKMEVSDIIFSGGDRPDQTFVHPSGDKAYVLNAGGADAIGVITLGDDPKLVKSFPSGNTGISWTNRGIRCNLAMTPSGKTGVLATPFDDEIQIIDLENDEIQKSLIAEGFPLQTALSDPINGKIYAGITLKNDGQVYIIEDVEGGAIPFGGLDVGGNPTRIAYSSKRAQFAVCSQDEGIIDFIDPANFEVVDKQFFPSHLTPLSVLFSNNGDQYTLLQSGDALLPNEFWINEESVEIGIAPSHYFDISPDGNYAAVAGLHEDVVYLIDAEVTNNIDLTAIDLNPLFKVGPIPLGDELNVVCQRNIDTPYNLEILDLAGRTVLGATLIDPESQIDFSRLKAGQYLYKISRAGLRVQSGQLVKL